MRQEETESLRAFLKRFNQATLEVPTSSPYVKINALTNGLRDGYLFYSLTKKHVSTFDDFLRRAEKYITLEEVRKVKKAESKPLVSEKKKAPRVKLVGPEPVEGRFHRKFEKYTPKKLQPTETENLNVRKLKAEQEMEHQEVAHVAATPSIQFGLEDVADIQHFHNDALMITTDIDGIDVAHIFVDTRSSCDIMFLECFKKMGFNVKLEPVEIALYEFVGGYTQPLGQVTLQVG
ncbi:hypothetical protein ACS0TY_030479 [Phlomoides rotata]